MQAKGTGKRGLAGSAIPCPKPPNRWQSERNFTFVKYTTVGCLRRCAFAWTIFRYWADANQTAAEFAKLRKQAATEIAKLGKQTATVKTAAPKQIAAPKKKAAQKKKVATKKKVAKKTKKKTTTKA